MSNLRPCLDPMGFIESQRRAGYRRRREGRGRRVIMGAEVEHVIVMYGHGLPPSVLITWGSNDDEMHSTLTFSDHDALRDWLNKWAIAISRRSHKL